MKKNYYSVLLLLLIPVLNFGQDVNVLHKNVKGAKTGMEKVYHMIKVAAWHLERYGHTDFPKSADSTWYYAKKCEEVAIAENIPTSLGHTYSFFTMIYGSTGQQDNAAAYARKAIDILEDTPDIEGLCNAYNRLLRAENQRVRLNDNLFPTIQKALAVARQTKKPLYEASTLELIGYYYSRFQDYKKTLEYLEQAAVIFREADNKVWLKNTLPNMAVFYKLTGNVDKALECNIETVKILNQSKNFELSDSLIYGTLADTYSDLGDVKASIMYGTKSWEIAKQYNNRLYQAFSEVSLLDVLCLNNMLDKARIHYRNLESYMDNLEPFAKAHVVGTLLQHSLKLGYPDKAEKYAKWASEYINSKNAVPEIKRNLDKSLTEYFLHRKEFEKSKDHAKAYENIAKQANSLAQLEVAYTQLFKIDSAQGRYLDAIHNYRLAKQYKDSMLTQSRNKEIARLETLYRTQEKEIDNQLLKKQAELQKSKLSKATTEKNLGIAAVLVLILAIGFIYRRYRINQKIRKESNRRNEMLGNLLTEKEWLLKEIHHRVKNNLQIVMSLLNTQSHFLSDEVAKAAIKNSQDRIHSMSLIHKRLYQSDNVVSIDMDLYIKELTEYFKITFDTGQKIKFIMDVEPIELTSAQAVPLGLIINETVINAIKHAFPINGEGSIAIILKELANNKIQLIIKDDGIGIKDIEEISESSSLGIKLIKGFSKELNADLEFTNNEGFIIYLLFKKTIYNDISLKKVSA